MRSARRRSRELAVQGMYQWLHTGGTASKIIKDLADLDGFEQADGEFLAAELKGTIASVAAPVLFVLGATTVFVQIQSALNVIWHVPKAGAAKMNGKSRM